MMSIFGYQLSPALQPNTGGRVPKCHMITWRLLKKRCAIKFSTNSSCSFVNFALYFWSYVNNLLYSISKLLHINMHLSTFQVFQENYLIFLYYLFSICSFSTETLWAKILSWYLFHNSYIKIFYIFINGKV